MGSEMCIRDRPRYPNTNPKNISVNEIGNPTNIENNITPISIKPSMAGSINSANIYSSSPGHLHFVEAQ